MDGISFVVFLSVIIYSSSSDSDPHFIINAETYNNNNSAVVNNPDGATIECVPPNASYTITWIDRNGNSVIDVSTAVIYTDGSRLISSNWPTGIIIFDASGVYSCKMTNSLLTYELYIGLYKSTIGHPMLVDNIQLKVYQYYPLIAEITLNSYNYPPTNVFWSVNNVPITNLDCFGFKSSQIVTDLLNSNYSIVLGINNCYCDGQFTVSINTNNATNISTAINISKASSPTNFTLVSLSNTSVAVSWSNSDQLNTIMQYCVVILSNVTCTNDGITNQLTAVYHQQENNSTVIVHLVSIGIINTIPSHPETINISLESPSTPSFLGLEYANNSIAINWNRNLYNVNNYLVPLNKVLINVTTSNCSLLNSQMIVDIDNLTMDHGYLTISELQPSIHYCISISLCNLWGSSQYTDQMCITTPITTTAPVTSPVLVNITDTQQYCSSVNIFWSPIPCSEWNGPLDYYLVCINTINGTCVHVYDTPYTELIGLSYYTHYTVKVARVNTNNQTGPFSSEANFITSKCFSEPPLNLQVITISIKTCLLKWSPPNITNGVINSYALNYSLVFDQDHLITMLNTSTLKFLITELYPNSTYSINVAAINEVGIGHSATVNITTKQIETVRNLTVNSANGSLLVRWMNLPSLDDDINHYILYYTIGVLTGNIIKLSNNNNSYYCILPGVSINTKYTISIVPVVTINGTITILGQWSNITGCNGECETSQSIALFIGSSSAVAVVIALLAVITIICVLSMKYRHRKPVIDIPLLEMHPGVNIPSIISKLDDLFVTEGVDTLIHAPVVGNPSPEITWFYNDDIIGDDQHFGLDEEDDSNLLLSNVQLFHAGVYQFTATNSLGSVNGQIRLFVEQEKKLINNASSASAPAMVDQRVETKAIPLKQFADYVLKTNQKNKREFKRQFASLQCFDSMDNSFGKLPENKRRNRFGSIIPYNSNRIVLEEIEGRGDCNHDYINASYIDGYKTPKQFIATQGPLPQTLVDFWRLIWQEKVECVVILLKELMEGDTIRCQQYWPDNGTAFYGPYKVTLEYKQTHSSYIKRMLTISPVDNRQPARTIAHIQFTEWPDHGIPVSVSPLLELINGLGEWLATREHPVIIHCSAGIGRTGVLLSVLIGLDSGSDNESVDILGIINRLRQQRMKIIQTEKQYSFVHYAVLEGLYCKRTFIDPAGLDSYMKKLDKYDSVLDMNYYSAHYKVLQALSPSPDEVTRNKAIDNPRLSRSKLFLPPDDHRVVLQKKKTDFIHASFLNGYQHDKSFIVAESPTTETVGLFWQMVLEQECAVIVMLCDCVELGENTCQPYWPASVQSEKHFGEYRLTNIGEHVDSNHIELQLLIVDTKTKKSHNIIQLQVLQWSPTGISSDHQSIIAAISRIEVIQRTTGNKPILVHCSDTVSRSGVFCTLYSAVQQCKTEQIINIYQILKSLRQQKPAFVANESLYRMVHELLERYIESEFEIYKNFSKSTKCLIDM